MISRRIDFDPVQEGIQTQTDQWGNAITDPAQPDPGRNDVLYDTTATDRIEGRGGDDYIRSSRGGNDWLLGGDGNDYIDSFGAAGNNILEGGAGSDVLLSGSGDDKIFSENYGEMESFITAEKQRQA